MDPTNPNDNSFLNYSINPNPQYYTNPSAGTNYQRFEDLYAQGLDRPGSRPSYDISPAGDQGTAPSPAPRFQPLLNSSWQQSPVQSSAPSRSVPASNGLQQYQSHYGDGGAPTYPQFQPSPGNSQAEQGRAQYSVPIDPALTAHQESLQSTNGSALGGSTFSSSSRQPATISPMALDNRPAAYKNPYVQPNTSNVHASGPNSNTYPRPHGREFLTGVQIPSPQLSKPQSSQTQSGQSQNMAPFPQTNKSVTYPQLPQPTTMNSPYGYPQIGSPASQPKFIRPQGNALMEAVVIQQPSGPPAKSPADLPRLPPTSQRGKLRVMDMKALEQATNSKPITQYLAVSSDVYRLEIVKASIPKYVDRRSRNEMEQLYKEGKIASLPASRTKKEKVQGVKAPKKVLKPGPNGWTISTTESPNATMVSLSGSSSSSESEEESESESESGDDADPEEASPLPATRPDDPVARVKYDTTKVVWSPRNKVPQAEKIANALSAYSELVKGFREAWKLDTVKLKEAEEKKELSLLRKCKSAVNQKRVFMETALKTTLDSGHPAIIKRLGDHPLTMAVLYSFLADRYAEGDIDGSLNLQILKAMSRFTTLDEAMLEMTKNNKILSRIVKKGGEDVKTLAQQVLDNAATATKAKTAAESTSSKTSEVKDLEEKPPSSKSSDAKLGVGKATDPALGKRAAAEGVAGGKRPRESDSASLLPQKRIVAPSMAKTASTDAAKPKTVIKKIVAGNPASKLGAAKRPEVDVKTKTTTVTPKPPAINLFSSLCSASKKPGTSNAALAAAAKQKASTIVAKDPKSSLPTRETKAVSPPPQRSTFSLSETLANLDEPKQAKKPEKVDNGPPETEEERKKRMRRESRRHLRVSFKPDDTLTDTRYFTHDPDEEISSGDIAMRDIGDLRSEGQALKRHLAIDDEDGGEGEELFDWYSPSEIDFGVMPEEERVKNYVKRGGPVQPSSEYKREEEARQATTLMAFYSTLSDIPPTPREPSGDDFEPADMETPFGEPAEEFRKREALIAARNPQPVQQVPTPAAVADLLARINAQKQPQGFPPAAQQSAPQIQQQSFLERTFGMYNQQQPQSQQPSQPPPQPAPALGGLDLARIVAQMNSQTQAQAQSTPPAQNPLIQNILAQFQQQNSNAQQGSPYTQNYGQQPPQGGGFAQNYGVATQTAQAGQNFSYGNENNAKRRTSDRDEGYEKRQKGKSGQGFTRRPGVPPVVCRFWKEGNCIKGASCTYRHSD